MTSGRIIRPEAETSAARLPLLGKIKCGLKLKNAQGKEYPASVDYFIPSGKYADLFTKAYGEKPNKIEIIFFSNIRKDVCEERYEIRDDKGRLLAEGDGQHWRYWSKERGEYVFGEIALEKIEAKYGKAKESMALRFILPRIKGVWGIWSFSTKGAKSSLPAIRDTFDQVHAQAGMVTNIPFDLLVEKVKSNSPGESRIYPVVTLVPNLSQENMDLVAEYIATGTQRLRGVLNEDRIKKLAAAAGAETEIETEPTTPALPAAPSEASAIDVAKVETPAPDPDPEDPDDGPEDDESGADAVGDLLNLK
jgi:hypothetical protein